MPFLGMQNWLLSAISAEGASSAMDCRLSRNYGYLYYQASGQSAIFDVHASHNGSAWLTALTVTATANFTGTAQIAAFYPYVRVNARKMFTGTGGDTSATATLWVHYSPGIGR